MMIKKKDICSISFDIEVTKYLITLWIKYKESKGIKNDLFYNTNQLISSNIPLINYFDGLSEVEVKIINSIYEEMKYQKEPIDPIRPIKYDNFISLNITESFNILEILNHDWSISIKSYIKQFLIVKSNNLIGTTSLSFLGIVVLSPKKHWELIDYIENIVHEASHIDLFIKQLLDPLVVGNKLLPSAFRRADRPQLGVLHATLVLCRIVECFYNIYKSKSYNSILSYDRLLDNLIRLHNSLLILINYADLSTIGNHLLFNMISLYNHISNDINDKSLLKIILT